MSFLLSRRQFLGASAAITSPTFNFADTKSSEPVAFFLVGDTHFFADKENTAKLDSRSAFVTRGLVESLNKLANKEIPKLAGGGTVLAPKGVIHAGDCIDTGDKANLKMQETEWAVFADAFGLNGKDGQLKMPVYEVHGNHDSPRGDGLAVKKIIERNKNRPHLVNTSSNGLHYSWDWGGVHFICLGIVVGSTGETSRKRRYQPLDSLAFLVSDLKEKVGTSGRPVIITQHVDMLRYAQPLPVDDKKAEGMEWDPADVNAYYNALKGYNIAAILYGHTHARNVYRWNGTNKAATEGIPTLNVDNSSHYNSKQQAFFYIEVHAKQLLVREYATSDAWATASWTPQVWSAPISAKS